MARSYLCARKFVNCIEKTRFFIDNSNDTMGDVSLTVFVANANGLRGKSTVK
jgi:hypothetical protein